MITGDLPVAAHGTEAEILKWVNAAREEGEAILKDEPAYNEIDKSIAYIMGEQIDRRRPSTLSQVSDNRYKNIVLQSVAALTDIHPLSSFKTFNPRFKPTEETLDKLARAWWINSFADLSLADVVKYAKVTGTGYCEIHWDPEAAQGAGDITITPLDPRTVLPIRPTMGRSIQSWEGVIVCQTRSVNEVQAKYPGVVIEPDRQPGFTLRTWTRAMRAMSQIVTPSAVDRITRSSPQSTTRMPTVDVFHTYLKDRRLHAGDGPVIVGDPDMPWSYTVYPIGYRKEDGTVATKEDAKMFPRGRLIVSTNKKVLYDGPNPYFHGMFPLARLCLDPWPWSLLGAGVGKDLIPLQDAINSILNGVLDWTQKALRPGLMADKKAVPESQWQNIDTRQPGLKLKYNAAVGRPIEVVEVPPLQSYVIDVLKMAVAEMDHLSGVANLQALTQLQQAPGADSIERMMEALTPLLRLQGRLLEGFLREVGEIVKVDFFQFYTMSRRVAMLGEAGVTFEDFDYEPGTLVPSMSEQDEGYVPQLDAKLSRHQRAAWHHKNFVFQITPNSLLAISQLSRKLLYLQLWRGGMMDPWTLFEVLEIPNGGTPPNEATTIVERLVLAAQMGLTGAVSPAGRKSSGQEAPQVQVKTDETGAPRIVMSESG